MSLHDVGAVADLDAAGHLVARVGGREVGVVRDPASGAIHAVRNRCPHAGAPLCRGSVRGRLEGTPGVYAPATRSVLACPWHGWEFDLASGRCLDDPALRVATYTVQVEGGRVLVDA